MVAAHSRPGNMQGPSLDIHDVSRKGVPMHWTRWSFAALLAALLVAPALPGGDKQKEGPTPPRKIVRLDPRFDKLVPKGATVETIARGFIWTEGPAWNKEGKFLVFSDIPHNVVNKWQEGKGVSKHVYPSGYTGETPRGGKPGDEAGPNGRRYHR